MNELSVKIDYAGRILLPKKVRNKYGLKENDHLLISLNEEGILLKKETFSNNFVKLIEKLDYLKSICNIDYIVSDKKRIIMTSDSDKEKNIGDIINSNLDKDNTIKYSNNTLVTDNLIIKEPHYYCNISIDSYTNCFIFLLFNDINLKDKVYSYFKMLY